MSLQQQVADSWRCNKARRRGSGHANMWTDGQTVWSYNRVIGISQSAHKIAVNCYYSVTTARHCNALKEVADEVIPCDECVNGGNHEREL